MLIILKATFGHGLLVVLLCGYYEHLGALIRLNTSRRLHKTGFENNVNTPWAFRESTLLFRACE